MTFYELTKKIKVYRTIIVSGPQRSGTKIAAKMLSDVLGHTCLLEDEFQFHDLLAFAKLTERKNVVIQAPTMSAVCHLLSHARSFDAAVVFMKRDVKDIENSQKRIAWDEEDFEKRQYFYSGGEPISKIKYNAWEIYQKPTLGNRAFELEYESMRVHPFWIEKEFRDG